MTSHATPVPAKVDHGNYLGAVRLFLSLLVLYSHSFPITGDSDEPMGSINELVASLGSVGSMLTYDRTLGGMAVDAFFVLSGFLIAQSWVNSRSAQEFAIKRLARIYPGYWVAFAFSMLVGTIYSWPASATYLESVLPYHDVVLSDLIFLTQGALNSPLVFTHNGYLHVVNGSFWTLEFEARCYLLLLILGSFALLKRGRAIVAVYVVSLLGLGINAVLYHGMAGMPWRFLSSFLAGTLTFLYRDSLPDRPALVAGALFGLVACLLIPILHPVLYPVCCGYLLLRLGFRKPPAALRWNVDLSYGVYLYAFPVQQACMATFRLWLSPVRLTLVSTPIVLALAWLSWHYVERPAIDRCRGRYRRPTQPAPVPTAALPADMVADAPATV